MTVVEICAYFRGKHSVEELKSIIHDLAKDHCHRNGKAMTHFEGIRLVQLRLAEDLRALDHPPLAQAMVGWILNQKLTAVWYAQFVVNQAAPMLRSALPHLLDEVARKVIETQNRLPLVPSMNPLFADEEEEEEDDACD